MAKYVYTNTRHCEERKYLRAEQVPLEIDPSEGGVNAEGERYRSATSRGPPRQPLGFLVAPADGVVAEIEVSH